MDEWIDGETEAIVVSQSAYAGDTTRSAAGSCIPCIETRTHTNL